MGPHPRLRRLRRDAVPALSLLTIGLLLTTPLSLGPAVPSNHEQHLFYGWRHRLVCHRG